MFRKRACSLLLALVAMALITPNASADWTKLPSADFPLAPYPAEGSSAHRRDFEILRKHQETRDRKSCELGRNQEHPTFDALFAGSPLSPAEGQKSKALVAKVMKLADRISGYHKGKFSRRRPYDADPTIKPCIPPPGGQRSYPSSHAAAGAAGACVLAEIFPEKKAELLAFGESIGELRVIVGVHHPSDVEAGQDLGREVCARVQAESDFQGELAKAKGSQ
jgi:acid phosphatase (class A)